MSFSRWVSMLIAACACSGAALAQIYPNKPIRVIIPAAPGDSCDVLVRLVAPKVGERLGQPPVIDNRPGSGGQLGLTLLKQSPADGYTLACGQGDNMVIVPLAYEKVAYDAQKDFAPVALMASNFLALAVNPDTPFKTTKDLIDFAKANPGKVSFASFGSGSTSHIYGEMLKAAAGLDMVHVPYKGAGPAVQDVIAGHAQMAIQDFAAIGPHLRSGRLVALAVTGPKRWPAVPELRTFVEQGYPLDIAGWNGIMAPAGTPRAIVERMSVEINKIIQTPDGRDQMLKFGLLATGTTPEELADVIRRDTPRWGEVIRKGNIKAQ